MLVVISPAKKLNSTLSIDSVPTIPIFLKNATEKCHLRLKHVRGFGEEDQSAPC